VSTRYLPKTVNEGERKADALIVLNKSRLQEKTLICVMNERAYDMHGEYFFLPDDQ